ncbi:MAG: hypothetical protein SPI30_01700 [Prevotella sp.]|nr:hypothetical protein [Prevotella sp.]
MKNQYIKPVVDMRQLEMQYALLVGSRDDWADGKENFFDDELESDAPLERESLFNIDNNFSKSKGVWED